eukprot:jgi/Phyca11/127786/e_gw1.72.177.1
MPRVTFIGPRELWRVQRKKFSAIYTIEVDKVFKWLAVLSGINSVFREEEIIVVDTQRRRELLREMASAVESEVHISESDVVSGIDEEIASESRGCEIDDGGLTDEVIVQVFFKLSQPSLRPSILCTCG